MGATEHPSPSTLALSPHRTDSPSRRRSLLVGGHHDRRQGRHLRLGIHKGPPPARRLQRTTRALLPRSADSKHHQEGRGGRRIGSPLRQPSSLPSQPARDYSPHRAAPERHNIYEPFRGSGSGRAQRHEQRGRSSSGRSQRRDSSPHQPARRGPAPRLTKANRAEHRQERGQTQRPQPQAHLSPVHLTRPAPAPQQELSSTSPAAHIRP